MLLDEARGRRLTLDLDVSEFGRDGADGLEVPDRRFDVGEPLIGVLEPARIVGRRGVELTQMWAGDPRAYLGMTIPDFPNFFCVYGPNTNLVAQGSIVFFSECSVRYVVARWTCCAITARRP